MDLLCIGNAMVDVFAELAPEGSPETALPAYDDFRGQFGLNAPVQHISPESAAAILAALAPAVCGAPPSLENAPSVCGMAAPPANAPVVVITAGGNAANTAKMAARLGLTVAFAGAAGGASGVDGDSAANGSGAASSVDGVNGAASNADNAASVNGAPALDHFGAIFEEELKRAGVSLYLVRKQSPTGLFISVTARSGDARETARTMRDDARQDIQRIIAASPSAALELDQNDVDESLFAQTRVLMLEGFLLGRKNLTGHFLAMTKKYGLTLAVDAGTADTAAEHAALIHSWFGLYPLVLFLNEKEAEAFTEALGFGPRWEEFFTGASWNSSGKSVLAAVKLAERGAAVFSDGEVYRMETKPVEAAETTGAGDAFAAGFLAAWLRGEGPGQCGQAGNAAAALVLRADRRF